MQTSFILDDKLIKKARTITGIKNSRTVIEEALKLLISLREQEKTRTYRGKLRWEGDLKKMRANRFHDNS